MTNVQMNNQLNNKMNAPPVHGERKGKRAMTRRAWAVVVLLAAGFFIHDAIWHAMLAVFGMNTMVGMEFSLLLWLGLRLGKRS